MIHDSIIGEIYRHLVGEVYPHIKANAVRVLTNMILWFVGIVALAIIFVTPTLLKGRGADRYLWVQVLASVVYVHFLIRCRLIPEKLNKWFRRKKRIKEKSILKVVIHPGYFLIALELLFFYREPGNSESGFLFGLGISWIVLTELIHAHRLMKALSETVEVEQEPSPPPSESGEA